MGIDYHQLVDACKAVRSAAQKVSNEKKIWYFSPFPRGWCGCVSRVLGAWLSEKYPNEKFYYVCGRRNGTHAWIEYDEIILDITADQFEDCNEEIIVKPYVESQFHQSFEIESKHLCYATDKDEYEEGLIYRQIETH